MGIYEVFFFLEMVGCPSFVMFRVRSGWPNPAAACSPTAQERGMFFSVFKWLRINERKIIS